MNIVYFIPHLRQASGMEKVLCFKANYLADKLGYNVTIITYRQFDSPVFFEFSDKIKFVHLNIDDPTFRLHQYSFFKRRIIYRNFIKTYRNKVEEFLLKYPTDFAISLFLGAEQYFLPEIKDKSKKIIEFHFDFNTSPFKLLKEKISIKNAKNLYYTHRFKKGIEKFDKIIVLTKEDAKDWKQYFSKVECISNPITITSTKVPALNTKTALAVGRLSHEKGFDLLIKAWKIVAQKHPDWLLNIYGTGELHASLQQEILHNHLEKQIFIHPPTKEIEEVYAKHSIFVLSSRHEGFPLVLIEALASGLPCVAFDCKHGPKQMINNGQNGFLVELGNVEKLAENITTLIENEELRYTFSKEAVSNAQEYSLDSIMKQWNNLFTKLYQ